METKPPAGKPPEPGRAEARPPAQASPGSQPPEAKSQEAPLDRFATLLGRAPTAAEQLELVRVKDALDLDNNDALWLLIMGLHHLRGEFEASIDLRLAKATQATEAILDSAKAQFLQQLPAELTKTAEKITVKALGYTGPVVLTGLIAGLALLIAGLGGVGWLAYDRGERSGYEKGVWAQRAATPPAPKPPAPPAKTR